LAGLEKPSIGLLSQEFLEDVGKMKTKNLAVELLERLIKDEIKARTKNDVGARKTATMQQWSVPLFFHIISP